MSDDKEMVMNLDPSEGCILVRDKRLELLVPDPEQCSTPEQVEEAYFVTTTMTYLMYCMEREDWRTEFADEMDDAGLDPGINYAAADEWETTPELEVLSGSGETAADNSKNPGLRLVRDGEGRESDDGVHSDE
jgi:hypothetical protein